MNICEHEIFQIYSGIQVVNMQDSVKISAARAPGTVKVVYEIVPQLNNKNANDVMNSLDAATQSDEAAAGNSNLSCRKMEDWKQESHLLQEEVIRCQK